MDATKYQEGVDFSYHRSDTICLVINHELVSHYPFSYTIKECLEDYCSKKGWDFHHMYSAMLGEGAGHGRFYYFIRLT